MSLTFRPMMSDDFPLLLAWLQRPHVKEWWDDGDDTLEKVAQHYGEADDTVRFILIEANKGNEQLLGYFQYYFEPDGSIGIDQFIGEVDRINQGIGQRAVKLFVDLINKQHHPTSIILRS